MVRAENQDSLGKFPSENLDLDSPKGQMFIIADGMGGHAGGREASRLAVETVQRSYFSHPGSNTIEAMKEAFRAANAAIHDFSLHNPMFHGMGTTCIALVLKRGSAYVAHVGDSRLYRISRDLIVQLTEDHSVVAEMVRRGILTEDEAQVHPERSMLYRAMGSVENFEFDTLNELELTQDDNFLLCTDGLSNLVTDEELKEVVLSHPPQGASTLLVDMANARGGYDNITVQIIHVKSDNRFLRRVLR